MKKPSSRSVTALIWVKYQVWIFMIVKLLSLVFFSFRKNVYFILIFYYHGRSLQTLLLICVCWMSLRIEVVWTRLLVSAFQNFSFWLLVFSSKIWWGQFCILATCFHAYQFFLCKSVSCSWMLQLFCPLNRSSKCRCLLIYGRWLFQVLYVHEINWKYHNMPGSLLAAP